MKRIWGLVCAVAVALAGVAVLAALAQDGAGVREDYQRDKQFNKWRS